MENGKWAVVLRSPVLPFFTFNEAQEFLLDNLLSAGTAKRQKAKGASKRHRYTHTHTQAATTSKLRLATETQRERETE